MGLSGPPSSIDRNSNSELEPLTANQHTSEIKQLRNSTKALTLEVNEMKNAIMAIRETTVLSSQAATGLNTSSAHKQTGRSNMQSQTASPDHDKYKK